MKEYFFHKKNYRGALNSTVSAKSFNQKLWDDSPYLLKQLPGIGMVTAKVFSITSFIISGCILLSKSGLVKYLLSALPPNAIFRLYIQWELNHLRH